MLPHMTRPQIPPLRLKPSVGMTSLGKGRFGQITSRRGIGLMSSEGQTGRGASPAVRGRCSFLSRLNAIFYPAAALSARFLRCVGCTNHAIPILTRYSTIMGAAKMHILRMSVVGVMMAAMMKMTRIE